MTRDVGVREALAGAMERLRHAGIVAPAREARLLMAHAQHRPRGLPDFSGPVPDGFDALIARRAAREPMALITGRQGFWTLDLEVSRATLIPRPDSEAVIEALLQARPDRAALRCLVDLGTGTGALLLAALREYAGAFGVGVDRAGAATALAARNARRAGLAARAAFVVGDWGACLAGDARFDAVLANPPYIPSAQIETLMTEVAGYEPRTALDGGADGLDSYRAIVAELRRLLRADGVAVLEVGQGQAEAVAALGRDGGLRVEAVRPDLSGIDRAVVFGHAGDAI